MDGKGSPMRVGYLECRRFLPLVLILPYQLGRDFGTRSPPTTSLALSFDCFVLLPPRSLLASKTHSQTSEPSSSPKAACTNSAKKKQGEAAAEELSAANSNDAKYGDPVESDG